MIRPKLVQAVKEILLKEGNASKMATMIVDSTQIDEEVVRAVCKFYDNNITSKDIDEFIEAIATSEAIKIEVKHEG